MKKATPSPALEAVVEAIETQEGPLTARKRRIVEAAVICFSERGYAATPTSEIARRAGVAEALIFRHFKNKKELLLRLTGPVAQNLGIPVSVTEPSPSTADTSVDAFIATLMRGWLESANRYWPVLRIIAQEMPFHPDVRRLFAVGLSPRIASIEAKITAFQDAGRMRKIPPHQVVRWLAALTVSYVLDRALSQRPLDDDQELQAAAVLLSRGLAPSERRR